RDVQCSLLSCRASPLLRRRHLLPRLAFLLHEARPEGLLRRMLVVSPAQEADVLHRRLPSAREFFAVIEFEILGLLAAPPVVRTHIRALRAITLPYRLLHRGRHAARSRLGTLVTSPGHLRRSELLLLELLD